MSTALPVLAALATGWLAFAIALATRRRERVAGERIARRSLAGIVLQGVGFAIAMTGPVAVTRDPLSAGALVQAAAVALAMAAAVALFVAATRAMGRNWSIVARTRPDHALVTTGPFARMRHPIYVAMALLLFATALALGHPLRLAIGALPFALGTWLRVVEEEKLLRQAFGPAYERYAREVHRFGLF